MLGQLAGPQPPAPRLAARTIPSPASRSRPCPRIASLPVVHLDSPQGRSDRVGATRRTTWGLLLYGGEAGLARCCSRVRGRASLRSARRRDGWGGGVDRRVTASARASVADRGAAAQAQGARVMVIDWSLSGSFRPITTATTSAVGTVRSRRALPSARFTPLSSLEIYAPVMHSPF
jgi:hypothetical protein